MFVPSSTIFGHALPYAYSNYKGAMHYGYEAINFNVVAEEDSHEQHRLATLNQITSYFCSTIKVLYFKFYHFIRLE